MKQASERPIVQPRKIIRWQALFVDGWKEVSVEDLLFRLIGSGLIRAYRATH
jgi:hypothetical protein